MDTVAPTLANLPDPKAAYEELDAALRSFDPIELLAQLTLTFLFVPEDEFQSDGSDVVKWSRYIEFVAGQTHCQERARFTDTKPTGQDLMKVEELLEKYFHAVQMHMLVNDVSENSEDAEVRRLLNTMKAYAMLVRGDAYPHQTLQFARELYTPHDEWFKANLGFTIDEAIQIAEAIPTEYAKRALAAKEPAFERGTKGADDYVSSGQAAPEEHEHIQTSLACQYYFGDSANLLAFTDIELAAFSGVPVEVCRSFLKRMSQEFGFRNPDFPQTFSDGLTAPWDYNTLKERPLTKRGERYWYFAPPTLKAALFATFFFDLFGDKEYRPVFAKSRGSYVETKVAEFLRRVFPEDAVLMNPLYPNGEELADVLVMHDRKIIIVQCKAKSLTHLSHIGADIEKVKSDLKAGVEDAFTQGARARDHLRGSSPAEMLLGPTIYAIDMDQVNAIYIVNVTLSAFQHLTTRFANLPAIGLFKNKDYPWSLSLGALDLITDLLPTPSHFIHYMTRRLEVEKTSFAMDGDEMDLLAFHLTRGLVFDEEEANNINALGIAGFSSAIDKYVFERFDRGKPSAAPSSPMPGRFAELIRDIERLGADYATDCAIALLDLSYKARHDLMEAIAACKQRTSTDGKTHDLSVMISSRKRGISFLSIGKEAKQDLGELASAWSLFKLDKEHCDEWVTLGWHDGSDRTVDAACFVAQVKRGDE